MYSDREHGERTKEARSPLLGMTGGDLSDPRVYHQEQ